MDVVLMIICFFFGAIFGSFLCCQARRLRLKEKGKKLSQRSECLHCGHKLKWYENIPIVSWLMLGGKCKKCKKKIGGAEILSEVGVGVAFVGYYMFSRTEILGMFEEVNVAAMCGIIMGFVTVSLLAFLAIYDGLYGELPQAVLTFAIICATITVILRKWWLFSGDSCGDEIMNVLAGVGIFAGVYFLLYKLSREKLVGAGDWQVAMAIALMLGDFYLSLLTVFVANFLACVVMIPVIKVKKRKNTKIYFGPWMVVGMTVVMMLGGMMLKMLGMIR